MKKHVNIPVFIPHLGCPNSCVFCNQHIISGVSEFDASSVIPIIEDALATMDPTQTAELAFFGGSFTGIDRQLMIKLLEIGNSYLKQGRIKSIRCSTRPDYINEEILTILSDYGVGTVELGLQSISDKVLSLCERGHDSEAARRACALIRSFGLRLGGQMMIGLPGSDICDEIKTAEFIVCAGCDEARIYPTVVFRGTELCAMTERNIYSPLSVDEAVSRSAKVLAVIVKAGIKVLRIGLCDSENLHSNETYYAGPNHPALGELVENEFFYQLMKEKLSQFENTQGKKLTVYAARGNVSKVIGQQKRNKINIIREYGFTDVKIIESENVGRYDLLPVINGE